VLGIELHAEAPEHLGERDERTQLLDRRGVRDRDVDGVLDERAVAKATSWRATSTATLTWASAELAPRCGVTTTRGAR